MVTSRETIQGMLLELEQNLPLTRARVGSVLTHLFTGVQPTIDLSAYDPDIQAAFSSSGAASVYGAVQTIDHGYGSGTRGAAGQVVCTMAAVPASTVHIYRAFTIKTDDLVASRAIAAFVTSGLANWERRLHTGQTDGANTIDLVATVGDQGVVGFNNTNRPWILYPGQILTVVGDSISAGKYVSFSFERETYTFDKALVDDSADAVVTTP